MLKRKDPKQIIFIDNIDKSNDIEQIEFLDRLVRIKFNNNAKVYSYKRDRIEIKENYFEDKKTKDLMKYFATEAQYSPIKIENENISILQKYIERIEKITDDMVLSYYVQKRKLKNYVINTKKLIYPFGINVSQKKAVENAFKSPISIIQGPPGTGKTQTILNIIANAMLNKKSIAVVSNNNSAVENVEEKLQKYNLDFLVAKLGSRQNREAFIAKQLQTYPDITDFKSEIPKNKILDKVSDNIQSIEEILEHQNKLAQWKQERAALETEQKYFNSTQKDGEDNNKLEKRIKKLEADKIFKIWSYCNLKEGNDISFWEKVRFFYIIGIRYIFLKDKNIYNHSELIQKCYYIKKIKELEKLIKDTEKYLANHKLNDRMSSLRDDSLRFLKHSLFSKINDKKRRIFSISDTTSMSDAFIQEYPVVLSTLFSLKNICKNNFIFDYVVVDEASQADLLTSTIAMSCARNIIIVGDIKQLPNVITKEVEENSEEILQNFEISEVYQFHKNSLLSSILKLYPEAPQTLLKEHYRCHPKIIGFCNNKFYEKELIVIPSDDGASDTLKTIKTNQGNHARGHINQRQIDVIQKEILPYLEQGQSIGVISPYRDQVNELRKILDKNIEVDTIHKFQGREKDIIVFSTVDNKISDFIDNPNLINVAVSRAVKKFWIVYSNEDEQKNSNIMDLINYIKYNNFEAIQSNICSIFDLLYKRYTEERIKFLQKHPKVSQYASENIAYSCIKECLNSIPNSSLDVIFGLPLKNLIRINKELYSEDEIQFIYRNSHVDFMIYNKMNKTPVLAIEVDGEQHRDNIKQKQRDELKNTILQKANIALLRLPTTGSGEAEKIISKLRQLIEF